MTVVLTYLILKVILKRLDLFQQLSPVVLFWRLLLSDTVELSLQCIPTVIFRIWLIGRANFLPNGSLTERRGYVAWVRGPWEGLTSLPWRTSTSFWILSCSFSYAPLSGFPPARKTISLDVSFFSPAGTGTFDPFPPFFFEPEALDLDVTLGADIVQGDEWDERKWVLCVLNLQKFGNDRAKRRNNK